MAASFQLHRSNAQADWLYVKEKDRNYWQSLAARSKGIITPANLVSVLGALLVIYGLVRLATDVSLIAIAAIATGRFADIADGFIAEKTKTKSPLGEAIDVSVDKFLAFLAIIFLFYIDLIPAIAALVLIIPNIINTYVSIKSKLLRLGIHPTKEGKIATAFGWIVLLAFCLEQYANTKYTVPTAVQAINLVLLLIYSYFAVIASLNYMGQLKKPR